MAAFMLARGLKGTGHLTCGRVGCPPRAPDMDPRGRRPWLGVVSERAQYAAVDPERLDDSGRVVESEDVGGG